MPPVIHIKETDSTNNYIKELLSLQDLEEGTVVYSDFQTAGKGQQGNVWESECGKNLIFSIVLYPDMIRANQQFVISQIVSLAVVRVLNKYANNITIKWPNDIYWNEKKICGVLIENSLVGETIKESVCGIGINVNQTEFISDAPNPVSLRQITDGNLDLEMLLYDLQETILDNYSKLAEKEYAEHIACEYKSALFRREGYHLYNDGISDFYAQIIDVESNGMLVLKTEDETIRKFAFKEVKYLIT